MKGLAPNHHFSPFVEMMHINSKVVSYNSLISACEKGQQWQLGLSLFTLMNCQALRSNHGRFFGLNFSKNGPWGFSSYKPGIIWKMEEKYVVVLLLHGFFRVKWIGWFFFCALFFCFWAAESDHLGPGMESSAQQIKLVAHIAKVCPESLIICR